MDCFDRLAERQDYEAVAALNRQVFDLHGEARPDLLNRVDKPLSQETYQGWLDAADTRVVVLEQEPGRLVGYAVLKLETAPDRPVHKPRKTVYVADIGVDERQRGQGLGKLLMNRVVSYARKWDADDVELNVSEFNVSAIGFYEKLGFRTKSRRMELIGDSRWKRRPSSALMMVPSARKALQQIDGSIEQSGEQRQHRDADHDKRHLEHLASVDD